MTSNRDNRLAYYDALYDAYHNADDDNLVRAVRDAADAILNDKPDVQRLVNNYVIAHADCTHPGHYAAYTAARDALRAATTGRPVTKAPPIPTKQTTP